MNEESKINALINIGQSKIIEKAYDDILSEPSKKAGSALGTIINIGNTVLWPVKWVNERTRIYFENNLKKYEEKISHISEDKIIEIPTEISMPILERFTYTSNEELSNAFVNLLVCASSIDDVNKAHPGFIQIIDRLSPDEAILLKYLANVNCIATLGIQYYEFFDDPKRNGEYVHLLKNATLLQNKVEFKFPENINIYLENLTSLAIIQERTYYYTNCEEEFLEVEKLNSEYLNVIFDKYDEKQLPKAKKVQKGMFEKTQYGELFIKACIQQ